MKQPIQVGSQLFELDLEKDYYLSDDPDEEEKLFRKALSLPIKKQIVYYKNKYTPSSAIKVVSIHVLEMFEVTDRWYLCELSLYDESSIRIHSAFLAEMQKPDFFLEKNEQEI